MGDRWPELLDYERCRRLRGSVCVANPWWCCGDRWFLDSWSLMKCGALSRLRRTERSSQPILKMDEQVCLKFSRRNFKILRARLEQETEENHLWTRSLLNVVSHSIDWGERSSQPILNMDEPVCLKSSRRNFKILRATLEQETAEKDFWT